MSNVFHQDFSDRTGAGRTEGRVSRNVGRGGFVKQLARKFAFYAGVLTLGGAGFLMLFGSSEEVDAKVTAHEEWLLPVLPKANAGQQSLTQKVVLRSG